MSTSSVLFDLPGPRARRRQRIGSLIGLVFVLLLVGLVLWRLGSNGQLDPARWAILFDTRTNVPIRCRRRARGPGMSKRTAGALIGGSPSVAR